VLGSRSTAVATSEATVHPIDPGRIGDTGAMREEATRPVTADDPRCSLRGVLDRVGDKWSALVMLLLRDGPQRHSQLQRGIEGISQRMLTLTLRGLERDGLVVRTVTPSTPPQVHYTLTHVGATLSIEVAGLIGWAERNREYLDESRRRFDSAMDLAEGSANPKALGADQDAKNSWAAVTSA
jgi:DNA-binding HxlR family transcriptional regulator